MPQRDLESRRCPLLPRKLRAMTAKHSPASHLRDDRLLDCLSSTARAILDLGEPVTTAKMFPCDRLDSLQCVCQMEAAMTVSTGLASTQNLTKNQSPEKCSIDIRGKRKVRKRLYRAHSNVKMCEFLSPSQNPKHEEKCQIFELLGSGARVSRGLVFSPIWQVLQ